MTHREHAAVERTKMENELKAALQAVVSGAEPNPYLDKFTRSGLLSSFKGRMNPEILIMILLCHAIETLDGTVKKGAN